MNSRTHSLLPLLVKGVVVASALGVTVPLGGVPAESAPKLEIWRGQRVLMLLPIGISEDWNADPQLGQAIPSLVRPHLIDALARTRKFSITSPYRFDPVLQRAVGEKRVPDAEVKALIATPTLETARPLMDKLLFDQPSMIGVVELVELRTAGTVKSPSLQLQVSARLYEQGNGAPLKSVVVTSNPVSGGSPEARLSKAASQAFQEVARQFVMPPETFALPTPALPSPPVPTTPVPVVPTPVVPLVSAPQPLPTVEVKPPNSLSTPPGESFIPVLPPARPPLGLSVPNPAGLR